MMQMEWILIDTRQQCPSLLAIQLLAHCESFLMHIVFIGERKNGIKIAQPIQVVFASTNSYISTDFPAKKFVI